MRWPVWSVGLLTAVVTFWVFMLLLELGIRLGEASGGQ